MEKRLEGVVVPIITPLREDFTLDTGVLEKLIERLLSAGVAGIFIAGTTGCGPALPQSLLKQLCRETVRLTAGRCAVLMGVSSASPAESVALARYSADCGADMVVAAAPCYLPMDGEELLGFYKMLAGLPLPVFIYNMPSMTKINLPPSLVMKLADVPNIVGYKDSAGDFGAFLTVLEGLRDRQDFSVMIGPEAWLTACVVLGAAGGVAAGANVYPDYFVNAYRAAKAGDLAAIRKWQAKIDAWQHAYSCRGQIGVELAQRIGLARLGLGQAIVMPPFKPVTREMEAVVHAAMDASERAGE